MADEPEMQQWQQLWHMFCCGPKSERSCPVTTTCHNQVPDIRPPSDAFGASGSGGGVLAAAGKDLTM